MRILYTYPFLGIAASLLFASIMILQYPLQTSFPIGGDVTRLIQRAEDVASSWQESASDGLNTLLTNSRYPGTTALLVASRAVPLDWPERFTWLIALGHIFTALSIGWLLHRISNWQAAAVGMALWSLTTVSLTGHIEDGTLAQLWSLPFVILLLERQGSESILGVLLVIFTAFLLHPMSGAVALLTALTSQATYVIGYYKRASHISKWIWSLALLLIVTGIGFVLIFITQDISVLFADLSEDRSFDLINALRSPFGPFLLLAVIGMIFLIQNIHKQPAASLAILVFATLSTLLTFNDLLGVSVLTFRFQSYFIITSVILAAITLPALTRMIFPRPTAQILFLILLLATSGLSTWNSNTRVFAFYEDPSNYARLHPDERAAIKWLDRHASPGSIIASTKANRHSEWIPILTHHKWIGLDGDDELWHRTAEKLREYVLTQQYTHVVLFKHREKPEDQFSIGMNTFPTVYQNEGAIILQLKDL